MVPMLWDTLYIRMCMYLLCVCVFSEFNALWEIFFRARIRSAKKWWHRRRYFTLGPRQVPECDLIFRDVFLNNRLFSAEPGPLQVRPSNRATEPPWKLLNLEKRRDEDNARAKELRANEARICMEKVHVLVYVSVTLLRCRNQDLEAYARPSVCRLSACYFRSKMDKRCLRNTVVNLCVRSGNFYGEKYPSWRSLCIMSYLDLEVALTIPICRKSLIPVERTSTCEFRKSVRLVECHGCPSRLLCARSKDVWMNYNLNIERSKYIKNN